MWIKLCGVREPATARLAAELGADAIGLNFYARSPRCVDVETARLIVRSLPESIQAIGLFVNHPLDEVLATADACRLQFIQLHGDESPEYVGRLARKLPHARLLRAFRIGDGDEGIVPVAEDLAACEAAGANLWACLLDSRAPNQYGGTGHVGPWDLIVRDYRRPTWPRLVLAGGLTPDNIAQAIARVSPWGVDVSSGIESSPGVKDPDRMRSFIAAARQAAPSI